MFHCTFCPQKSAVLCWQLVASSPDLTLNLNRITQNHSSESTVTAEFQLTPVLCHSLKKIYLWAGCWRWAQWYKVKHAVDMSLFGKKNRLKRLQLNRAKKIELKGVDWLVEHWNRPAGLITATVLQFVVNVFSLSLGIEWLKREWSEILDQFRTNCWCPILNIFDETLRYKVPNHWGNP